MQHAHCSSRVSVNESCSSANKRLRARFERLQMNRGQIRVIRHTHKCIATFFACASFHVPTCSLSPAVGKVGKPRWGHPLVEFVILGEICRKNSDWNRLFANSCMLVHSHTH